MSLSLKENFELDKNKQLSNCVSNYHFVLFFFCIKLEKDPNKSTLLHIFLLNTQSLSINYWFACLNFIKIKFWHILLNRNMANKIKKEINLIDFRERVLHSEIIIGSVA